MSRYNYNKNFFKTIDNETKAYWLGFLYADGCITRFYRNEKLKSMSLELTLKEEDKGHLFRFLSDLESNVPIQNRIINNKYKACRVVINCTSMCRDLINLGCTPEKSLTLKFPNKDILDKKYYKDFIRGYFDGDGCVYFNKTEVYHKARKKTYLQKHYNVSFVGTEDFLTSIINILEENGVIPNDNFYECGQAKQFYIYGQDNIYKFYKYIYDNSSIYLKRKYNTFQYAIKNIG
jgi:hypothetical protein